MTLHSCCCFLQCPPCSQGSCCQAAYHSVIHCEYVRCLCVLLIEFLIELNGAWCCLGFDDVFIHKKKKKGFHGVLSHVLNVSSVSDDHIIHNMICVSVSVCVQGMRLVVPTDIRHPGAFGQLRDLHVPRHLSRGAGVLRWRCVILWTAGCRSRNVSGSHVAAHRIQDTGQSGELPVCVFSVLNVHKCINTSCQFTVSLC